MLIPTIETPVFQPTRCHYQIWCSVVYYQLRVLVSSWEDGSWFECFWHPLWLIDYDGMRVYLRTATTNGPIVHPWGDTWTWRAMMMMSAGDNSWPVHQSSLVVLPAETSGESRRNGRRSENFAYQYLKYLNGSLTCRKILRRGTSDFTSHPKEGVMRIFIALKNPSPRSGLNQRP
jgi:hypothetical protein